MEIKLTNPVEVDGVTRTAITLREIRFADLAAINRLNATLNVKGAHLARRLTGWTPNALQRVLEADPMAAAQVEAFITAEMEACGRGERI